MTEYKFPHALAPTLGTSKETPEFAVDAIEIWLTNIAFTRCPGIEKLLILCNSGGNRNGDFRIDEVSSGSGYASQNSLILHFGLSEAENVDIITVSWPGQAEEYYENIEADKFISLPNVRASKK